MAARRDHRARYEDAKLAVLALPLGYAFTAKIAAGVLGCDRSTAARWCRRIRREGGALALRRIRSDRYGGHPEHVYVRERA